MRGLLNRRVAIAVFVVGGLLAVAVWPSAVPVDVGDRGPRDRSWCRRGGRADARSRSLHRVGPGRGTGAADRARARRSRSSAVRWSRGCGGGAAAARCQDTSRSAGGTGLGASVARPRTGRRAARAGSARTDCSGKSHGCASWRGSASSPRRSSRRRRRKSRTAEESANAAAFAVRAATPRCSGPQARLNPSSADPGRVVTVTAPVDGVVLKRIRESESVVPAGDPLLEIGDPSRAGDRRRPAVDRRRPRQARRPRDHRAVGRRADARRARAPRRAVPASRRSRRSASKSSASTSSSTSSTPRTHGRRSATPIA